MNEEEQKGTVEYEVACAIMDGFYRAHPSINILFKIALEKKKLLDKLKIRK